MDNPMTTSPVNAPLTQQQANAFREALLTPPLADQFIDYMIGYSQWHAEASEAVRRFAKINQIELP